MAQNSRDKEGKGRRGRSAGGVMTRSSLTEALTADRTMAMGYGFVLGDLPS